MSINAISSVSLYEYYYTINKEKEKKSPLADEMEKYGLKPTDDEALNAFMLQRAKQAEKAQKNANSEEKETSKAERPWADIMYQLNIPFNDNPIDDIQDIKDKLQELYAGIEDEELEQDLEDLVDYVEKLYLTYTKNNSSSDSLLALQMNNLSAINKMSML